MFAAAMNLVRNALVGDPKAPNGESRSPHWPKVRKAFLTGKVCLACGGVKNLEAHHREPFHVNPALELDPRNLVPLCEAKGRNCHFAFGHGGKSWSDWLPNVVEIARAYNAALSQLLPKE